MRRYDPTSKPKCFQSEYCVQCKDSYRLPSEADSLGTIEHVFLSTQCFLKNGLGVAGYTECGAK